ncbi:hypothetical protein LINGRAHAP2_LOCUS19332 [Linum grandiflorum]
MGSRSKVISILPVLLCLAVLMFASGASALLTPSCPGTCDVYPPDVCVKTCQERYKVGGACISLGDGDFNCCCNNVTPPHD